MRTCAVVVLTLVVAAPLHAATLTVDDDGLADYNSIRAAVAAAGEGDTVEVRPGLYQELVELRQSINLVGVDLPSIVGPPPSPVMGRTSGIVWGISIYASACLVDGFRIERGAGLEVRGSDGTIRNNFFDGATIELMSCTGNTLSNNHASHGGIYLHGSNNTLRDNVITDSSAGIYLTLGSLNTLRNNEISGCNTGLGLASSRQNVLRDNRMHDNTINFDLDVGQTIDPNEYDQDIDTSNTVDGKPIYYLLNRSDVVVDATSNAGCVVAVNCSHLTISDVVLNRNRDGLLFVNTRDSRVERVTARQNTRCGICLVDSPGNSLLDSTATDATFGIFLEYSGDCTLRNNTMADNTYNFGCHDAPEADYRQDIDTTNLVDGKPIYYLVDQEGTVLDGTARAGCIFAVGCKGITVRDQTLTGNDRGLVLLDCQSPTLENVAVVGNNWAGIEVQSCTEATISGCSVSRNYEGVVITGSRDARLINNVLARNYRGLRAAGSDLTLSNCYVHGNVEMGGIIFEYGIRATVLNCTICNNANSWWTTDAGGIHADYTDDVTIANTIIWGNHPAQLGEERALQVTHCDIQGGFPGPGNIDEPPRLTPDGHLCLGSPCIDAGQVGSEYPTSDVDGEQRIYGPRVDMGMDEYISEDNDALPNWWELQYFGAATAAEAGADPDGDGHTNVVEYELYSSDPTVPAVTYYVDADRPDDSGDGLSWETAKRTVQAAIDQAADSDRVHIAPGIYDERITTHGSQILIAGLDANDPNTIARTVLARRFTIGSNEGPGCVVSGLTITSDGEAGLYCSNARPTIQNCLFTGRGQWHSGGIWLENAAPTISHCTISGICGDWQGKGVIHCWSSTPVLRNCLITGNIADRGYGGVADALSIEQSDVIIDRCTIANNGSPYEDSSGDSAISCVNSRLRMTNSILWNDLPRQIKSSESTISVTYSDIKDSNDAGEEWVHRLGNIVADPCFVAPGGWDASPVLGSDAHWTYGDYRLQSTGWQNNPDPGQEALAAQDVHISRCIDAGNPAEALGDEPVAALGAPSQEGNVNLRIDMGAYGGTAEASPAPAGWALLTDFNNDGTVNFLDFHHYSQAFRARSAMVGDANRDARVDYAELSLLANDWLRVTDWSGWKAYRSRR
jgi:parallel beta-helix repeat protein